MISNYLHAMVAGLIAALASLEGSLTNGSGWSASTIISAIIAGLIAFSAVAFVSTKTNGKTVSS